MDIEQENRRLRKAIADKDHRINILEEYILSLKQKQFGSSSEKLSPTQTGLFDEADDTEATVEADSNNPVESIDIPAHSRSAKRRVSIPADIPRVDIVHDLPGDQKVCPHDGTALKCIGSETHKQLDIILATVQVLNHIRYKYACPCCEKYLITATKPAQAIEKSIASAGLLAYIATQKYVDGLPLYRQVEIFKCIGIEMDRGTLASWMVKSGQLVQPLINLIHEKILAQHFLHMDETQVQVLNEPNKTAQSKSYMWVLRSTQPTESAVLFRYEPSRSGAAATDLLDDFTGTLMVDSYEGYNAACSKNSINRLGCWAHARRKFIEAQKVQVKGKIGRADWAVAHIQKLYRLEAKLAGKTAEEKYTLRQQHTVPLLKE
ncbi:MAG: IS66 family transposase, partial [Candidatus Saccharibacteria bacterium]|nr:IS66 family transposase [Candidatus Saccharibacteria bacterium]